MTWTHPRSERLPPDWPKIRRRILKRDPVCKCKGCINCTPNGCQLPSNECDHVLPTDDHSDSNLQGLCAGCHQRKTTREATAARIAITTNRRRPTPRHPGLTGGG